jgi:predicted dienelactone hydrolase
LIVLSHGTGGGAATMAWLAETLAAHGYLVAAVNHHGNTGAEDHVALEGFVVWWDRPQDLSLVIDAVLADPRFADHVDPTRIAVAGFSVGAYSTIAAVGGQLNQQQWLDFCGQHPTSSNCKLPPEAPYTQADLDHLLAQNDRVKSAISQMGQSYRDPRFAAAFAIAPVLGPVLTASSLAAISVPVHLVVGTADDQAVPSVNAQPTAAAMPTATLELLDGVTHYSFLPRCTWLGGLARPQFCDDPPGVDRVATQQHVALSAVAFFDHVFGR